MARLPECRLLMVNTNATGADLRTWNIGPTLTRIWRLTNNIIKEVGSVELPKPSQKPHWALRDTPVVLSFSALRRGNPFGGGRSMIPAQLSYILLRNAIGDAEVLRPRRC